MNIIKFISFLFGRRRGSYKDKEMEKDKYIPRKDKVLAERFSNEELLDMLPVNDHVNRESVKAALDYIFAHMGNYQGIWDYLKSCINETFLPPTREQYSSGSEYAKEYSDYFFGDEYQKFIRCCQSEFLNRSGERRTFDEACQIAADKWVEMLFDFHLQDNGDRSGHSDCAMMLGTALAEKAKERLSKDVAEKTRELLKEYYLNGCQYQTESGHCFRCEPYSDYGPNSPLYDILIKAGVEEKDACRITPWKTGIEVDENDNTVVLIGYQKVTFI